MQTLAAVSQTAIDEDSPWPRVRSTNGNTVTLHMPQVERWTSNSFTAHAAVEVKLNKVKDELLGAVWFEAHGAVDRSNRIVTLDRLEITKASFPEARQNETNAFAAIKELIPEGARTVSLDYLITTLGFARASARQGAHGFKHDPPQILWVTNRAVLVIVKGEPVTRPIQGSPVERVVNTPALMLRHAEKFYLAGQGRWFSSTSIAGPWSLVQELPPEVLALNPNSSNQQPVPGEEPSPRIIVSTKPAELVITLGAPDWKSIRGTKLQYAANSDSQLFFETSSRQAYLLLSGRWFKASSLNGPWSYVAPSDLPEDFARIPKGSPQAVVLASVPGTPQAELALLANSVPETATVDRRKATISLDYDGEPKFMPIEGTSMKYAVNAQLPVVQTDKSFYALDNGVWFTADSPKGPWQAATEVPEEIYTIPPDSPIYYATFANVYQSSDDQIEVGYTPGYTGAYEDQGTEVYGTGWDYEPWYGDVYYGWGWTWGYGYLYAPWYQAWLWRPWWNEPGGLRAALIENIYDRWIDRGGVAHPEPYANGSKPLSSTRGYSGHPALYGRFQGAAGAQPLRLPSNTLALNPYSRPKNPVSSREVPHGAALLMQVYQAPHGGRDLYASPDGQIYRRQKDGWYRRDAGKGWALVAPTQGTVDSDRLAAARPAQPRAGTLPQSGSRLDTAAALRQARGNLVPDSGIQARVDDVAALERQYYARSLATMQAQNRRAIGNFNRRGAVGRRR